MTPAPPAPNCFRRGRYLIISTLIFLGIQWVFRLGLYPPPLQSFHEPKPISPWLRQSLVKDPEFARSSVGFSIIKSSRWNLELSSSLEEPTEYPEIQAGTSPDLSSSRSRQDGDVINSYSKVLTSTFDSIKVAGKDSEDVSGDFSTRWGRVIQQRKQLVQEVCNQYSILKKRAFQGTLDFDDGHRIAYCRNAKAGTTTMLSILLENAGVNVAGMSSGDVHEMADKILPPLSVVAAAAEEKTQLALLFTVVRHPFTRLVSAYRDKIPEHYRQDLWPQMTKYREPTDQKGNDSAMQEPSQPTFREFVRFVSDEILSCPPIANSACLPRVDAHWRPIYDRCAPCDLTYDVIAKVETLHEDEQYIRKLAGLPAKSETGQIVHSHAHASPGPSTTNLTIQYFSELTEAEKKRVFKAYFYDFKLFGYSPDIIV